MSESTGSEAEIPGEGPLNDARVELYSRLMEAQERIALARYARGATHETVLAALDAAETEPSDDERREDLYLSSLAVYLAELGGRLELRAVFEDESILLPPSERP